MFRFVIGNLSVLRTVFLACLLVVWGEASAQQDDNAAKEGPPQSQSQPGEKAQSSARTQVFNPSNGNAFFEFFQLLFRSQFKHFLPRIILRVPRCAFHERPRP